MSRLSDKHEAQAVVRVAKVKRKKVSNKKK